MHRIRTLLFAIAVLCCPHLHTEPPGIITEFLPALAGLLAATGFKRAPGFAVGPLAAGSIIPMLVHARNFHKQDPFYTLDLDKISARTYLQEQRAHGKRAGLDFFRKTGKVIGISVGTAFLTYYADMHAGR